VAKTLKKRGGIDSRREVRLYYESLKYAEQRWDTTGEHRLPYPTKKIETKKIIPMPYNVSVDVSTTGGNPGFTEYRGVDTETGELLFENKYPLGTNNQGEFLAIVHALAEFKRQGINDGLIYSDSTIAIGWVKKKVCRTNMDFTKGTERLQNHLDRAVKWLKNNSYTIKVKLWVTKEKGQIKADYGRK
jgi:ribonuclease HI